MKKIRIRQPDFNHGQPRLDNFLAQNLPSELGQPISKGQIRKLIIAGAVYLNGHRTRIASKYVNAGATVEVMVDLTKLEQGHSPSQDVEFEVTPEHIVFEDENLIVLNKPYGIPSQPTVDRARNNVFDTLKRFLKNTRGDDYAGLHHRLDRDTSGLILFTKRKEANGFVSDLFRSHRIQKTYLAWTGGRYRELERGQTFSVENHLARNPSSKIARFQSVKSGGDLAITDFEVLEVERDHALIQCRPKTGRTHQIRVHLFEAGLPILGDRLYGGIPGRRLHLHAWKLQFPHPTTNQLVIVEAPLPSDLPGH